MKPSKNRRSGGRPIGSVLKRRGLYVLIPMCLVIPGAVFYARKLPHLYRAKALVGATSPLPGSPVVGSRVDPATVNAQEQLRAIRETLLTPDVLRTVVAEFNLKNSDIRLSGSTLFPWRDTISRLSAYFVGQSETALHPEPPTSEEAADILKSKIDIQVDSPSSFYIGYESAHPELAAQVSNRLASLFVQRTSIIRGEIVQRQDSVLDTEVERTRNQLLAAEEALKAYKSRSTRQLPERLASNQKALEDLQARIQSRTDKITESEARRASIQEELGALERQGVLKQQQTVTKSPHEIALDEKRIKLNELLTRYTSEYPEIVALKHEIRDLEDQPAPAPPPPPPPSEAQLRYYTLKSELTAIEPRLASYSKERADLVAEMPEYQRRIDASPANEAAVAEQTKDAAMLRARYEALFAKQQEQRLSQRAETTTVSLYKILEPARVPDAPFSPHRDRILLFSIIASLGLGIGGVFLAEQLDSTFDNADEVENFAALPVLTAVPRIPSRLPGTPWIRRTRAVTKPLFETQASHPFSPVQIREFQKHRVPVLGDPQSVQGQQFGILALKIERRMRDKDRQMLAVTSAIGEEGKSVTALNLAFALSEGSPGKVLLVDCDLRLPQVHRRLSLSSMPGFGDLLQDEVYDFEPYITRVGNLDVIPGGRAPSNPAALLASAKTRQVLQRLRQSYEFLVLDCPPLIPIADSHLLADAADAVLMVVRARRTVPALLRKAIESVGPDKILGLVLNDVKYAGTPYAYAYRHYQRHYLGRR